VNPRRASEILKSVEVKPFWELFDRYVQSVTHDLRNTRDASYLRALDALDYVRGIPETLARMKVSQEGKQEVQHVGAG
jgi:hypothetical protein